METKIKKKKPNRQFSVIFPSFMSLETSVENMENSENVLLQVCFLQCKIRDSSTLFQVLKITENEYSKFSGTINWFEQ